MTRTLTLLALALIVATTHAMSPKAVAPLIPRVIKPQVPPAIGVWRLEMPQQHGKSTPRWRPGVSCFLYDGKYVTLRLFTEKEWMWKRQDDHYRVAAMWKGDKLFYRPPFGRWEYLATFQPKLRRFTLQHKTITFRFLAVQELPSLRAQERILLLPRPPHDYRIKPTDPRQVPKSRGAAPRSDITVSS